MRSDGGGISAAIAAITDDLVASIRQLTFSAPVSHTYHPLVYARRGYDRYVTCYGDTAKAVILVGMNPGPFGMAQTGVPFGDVEMVDGWMGINTPISQPSEVHPKRPISGFSCTRREVSGRRLWRWAKHRYGSPTSFFEQFFVLNYCPLVFMEASGRNRTPDKLPAVERKRLFKICDLALKRSIAVFKPQWVVGIGGFAEKRINDALAGMHLKTGRITHPSPANPKANQGWVRHIESELASMGIDLPEEKE
jgi:single-strand selective monofunctional uracil DNA glycosylase